MLECISINYPYDLSFYEERDSLIERKRLLSMLLARRKALRVICAPSLYGKSVLAFQYANKAFDEHAVKWIDASDPEFLLALDGGAANCSFTSHPNESLSSGEVFPTDETCLVNEARSVRETRSTNETHSLNEGFSTKSHDDRRLLFVVDGCPVLDEDRFAVLQEHFSALLSVGHEVVMTTWDTRWMRLVDPRPETIDADLLLLDERERALWSNGSRSDSATGSKGEAGLLGAIAGCRAAKDRASARFFETLLARRIQDETEALSLVMLLLGSGALHELRAYTTDLSSVMTRALEHQYPHTGLMPLSSFFNAIELDDRERFLLFKHHLSDLVHHLSAFSDEGALIKTLIDHLLERDSMELATQLVSGWHDEDGRASFFGKHGHAFLFQGKPLALLQIAGTLPRSFFSSQKRWIAIMIALVLLEESELALRVMRSFRRGGNDGSSDGGNNGSNDGSPSACLSTVGVECTFFSEELSEELNAALTCVLLGIGSDEDRISLTSLVAARLESFDREADTPSSARPILARDLLLLVDATLRDPCLGFARLQKITSAGYAIKEILLAMCLFTGLVLFLWRDRCKEHPEANGSLSVSDEQGMIDQVSGEEERMLANLEGHLVHILSRQATLLPANIGELYLFDTARALLGERVYLLVNDEILGRIEAFRMTLDAQRSHWKEHRLSGQPIEVEREMDERSSRAPTKKALRINTLGRFEIEPYDAGITVKNKVRKQLRLLISLLAINEGREIARPWVQRTMWPDAPDRNARQNLYTMWSLLNKSVIDREGRCPFFESYPQSLALNSSLVETDTHLLNSICKRLRYEKLEIPLYERAIDEIEDLYRGELLPGDETAEVVAHRKRYQDLLIEALMKAGEQLRKRGETKLALRYFRFAFDTVPTREDVCYQLMLALWKLGRHAEALNEYFTCRRALIDSYGIEGTRKLRELYETILRDAS